MVLQEERPQREEEALGETPLGEFLVPYSWLWRGIWLVVEDSTRQVVHMGRVCILWAEEGTRMRELPTVVQHRYCRVSAQQGVHGKNDEALECANPFAAGASRWRGHVG